MKYRNFSEEMQEKDLKEVLEIIYPDTIFCGYKRMEREIKILHTCIRVPILCFAWNIHRTISGKAHQ